MRERRLVTLIGPGGAGKTRLALQIAAELVGEVEDGVFFVQLAEFADPDEVVPAVLQLFGSQEPEAAANARGLVVLDNFEHLIEAAPAVAQLLGEAPGLRLLVTSRTPLRVSGEVEYQVEPLPQDAAVELFLERARSQNRRYEPSDVIDLICQRVDRLPLALELAAARLKLLEPRGAARPPRRAPAAAHAGRPRPARAPAHARGHDRVELRPAHARGAVRSSRGSPCSPARSRSTRPSGSRAPTSTCSSGSSTRA